MPLPRPFGKSKKSSSSAKRSPRSPFLTRHTIEALEKRVLLTTLFGSNRPGAPVGYVGDTFEFQDISGQFQRIRLTGNITAEVVGAEVDPLSNRVQLVDLPGELNGTQPLNGGILTPQGAQLIGNVRINDSINNQSIGPAAIHALATDPTTGAMYGLAVVANSTTAGGGGGGGGTGGNTQNPNLLDVVRIPATAGFGGIVTATVIAEIQAQTVAAAGGAWLNNANSGGTAAPEVTGATAAAWDPINSRVYFVATGGTANIPVLFSIDVRSNNNGAIQGSVVSNPGTFGSTAPQGSGQGRVFDVSALVWDQNGPSSARLIAAINPATQNAANGARPVTNIANEIFVSATAPGQGNTDAFNQLVAADVNGNAITGITIANGDNPNANDDVLFGTVGAIGGDVGTAAIGGTGGAAAAGGANANTIAPGSVIQIHLPVGGQGGYVTGFGNLYLTAQPGILPAGVQNILEAAPGDLTFNPTLTDPFTGRLGAMIATDAGTGDIFYVSPFNRAPNDTIYAIYISQADITGGIAVGAVATPTAQNILRNRPMTPFAGSIGNIRTSPTVLVAAPAGSGTAFLGARTLLLPQTTGTDNIPILTATLDQQLGVLPVSAGTALGPGLYVAPGVILGKFLFGGTVTGQVSVAGSIDEFYAGWLITGNAGNTTATAPDPTNPNDDGTTGGGDVPGNFSVGGDIRNLIVKGPIGTAATFTGSNVVPAFVAPTYTTGFDMIVGGSIGQVKAGGSIVGNIHALNSPAAGIPLITSDQTEAANPAWTFENVQLGGDPFLNDNSFTSPQYLGSIPTVPGQANSQIKVDGELEAVPPNGVNDFGDYYSVPLMAGQTVVTQLSNVILDAVTLIRYPDGSTATVAEAASTPLLDNLSVGIFDPDGRLVATDYSDILPALVNETPIRFTADKPGVYRFVVSTFENAAFSGTSPGAGIAGTWSYTLSVQGVGNIGIGGIASNTSIYDGIYEGTTNTGNPVFDNAAFGVLHGDMGAIVALQNFLSIASGAINAVPVTGGQIQESANTTVDVANGNLRAMEAGSMGIGLETPTGFSFETATGIEFKVPNGSVGLINVLGDAQNNVMYLNEAESTSGGTFNVVGGQFQGVGIKAVPVGGDIQVVSCVGPMYGGLYANGSIGVIRAGDMDVPENSQFFVDMDQKGDDGIIDLIDVTANFGSLGVGGPEIRTGPGGDVRYIHVGGQVFQDLFFGAGQGTATPYSPGTAVTITDDSGSLVTITPIDNTVSTTTVTNSGTGGGGGTGGAGGTGGTSTSSTTTIQSTTEISRIDALTTYGIEGTGGVVIVNCTVFGSVDISSRGDVPGQVAEIGTLVILGTGTAVINSTVTTPAITGGTPVTTVVQPPVPPPLGSSTGTTTGGTTGGAGGTTSNTTTTTITSSPIPTLVTPGPAGFPGLQESAAANGINGTGSIPLFVQISGAGEVDLFEIIVETVTTPIRLGNLTTLSNTTGGEMVNIQAGTMGQLISNGPVGIAKQHTGATPNQLAVLSNLFPSAILSQLVAIGSQYPFLDQRNGVVIAGNLLSIQAPELGNIVTIDGHIGQVIASAGGEGILGPIFTFNTLTPPVPWNIGSVQIGGGIAPSGSGAVGLSGIYVDGRLGPVSGSDADIRGNIIADQGIDSIHLHNGSLINTDIAVTGGAETGAFAYTEPNAFSEPVVGRTLQGSAGNSTDTPILGIGSVTITGNGGIIGTFLGFDHMGTLAVSGGGFGIFTSEIVAQTDGTIDHIHIDGYGLRDSFVQAGLNLLSLQTLNNGKDLPVSNYSPDVRLLQLNHYQFDPYFEFAPNILTDLDIYLGTTAAAPLNGLLTVGGIMADSVVNGGRNLGTFSVYRIQSDYAINLPTNAGDAVTNQGFAGVGLISEAFDRSNINVLPGQQYLNQIDFAGQIATLSTVSTISNLGVTTGKLKTFRPGSNISNMDMEVSGKITSILIHGNLDAGSIINAKGINGNIGTVHVFGNLNGSITARKKISAVIVDGSFAGTIDAPNITKITLNGKLQTGTFTINGNLGTLIDTGDFGTNGQSFVIHGSAKLLRVAGNYNTNTTIDGKLTSLIVGGSITTNTQINIAKSLGLLQVGGDIQAGAVITAHPLPPVKKQKISGQVLGTLVSA